MIIDRYCMNINQLRKLFVRCGTGGLMGVGTSNNTPDNWV